MLEYFSSQCTTKIRFKSEIYLRGQEEVCTLDLCVRYEQKPKRHPEKITKNSFYFKDKAILSTSLCI